MWHEEGGVDRRKDGGNAAAVGIVCGASARVVYCWQVFFGVSS